MAPASIGRLSEAVRRFLLHRFVPAFSPAERISLRQVNKPWRPLDGYSTGASARFPTGLGMGTAWRYDTATPEDGLPPGEGAFLPCSFWLADAYVLLGRVAEAQRLFARLVGLCNDVGLLAEEYDTVARRLVGNFPQAFSHIGLVNTAHHIAHATKPCEQSSGNPRLAAAE